MKPRINEVLFRETSTIGVRKYQVDKTMLDRKIEDDHAHRLAKYGLNQRYYKGVCIKSKPEYEDCIKIAREKGIPVNQVYREVEQAIGQKRRYTMNHELLVRLLSDVKEGSTVQLNRPLNN